MNQIDRIMEIVGRPSPEDVTAIKSPFAATMLDNLPPTKPKPLSKVLENASAEALDLLRKCLHFNPQVRLAAEKSLCHPYVNKFRNTEDEPVYGRSLVLKVDDNKKYSANSYRDRLNREITRRKKERRRKRDKEHKRVTAKTAAKKVASKNTSAAEKKKNSTESTLTKENAGSLATVWGGGGAEDKEDPTRGEKPETQDTQKK